MRISGFQKLTLTDYPGKIASIIFTQGCNYRCSFCYNRSLLETKAGLIDENEILVYLAGRCKVLEGVVISGGEPTIQPDLKQFITKIKQMGFQVKLDTNGSNPEVLKELFKANLIDYVAMDIKTNWPNYPEIVGGAVNYEALCQSVHLIKEAGIDYEFRTTIVKEFHTIDTLHKLVALVDGSPYYIQNFQVEGSESNLHSFSQPELEEISYQLAPYSNVQVRGVEVALRR